MALKFWLFVKILCMPWIALFWTADAVIEQLMIERAFREIEREEVGEAPDEDVLTQARKIIGGQE